MEEFAIAANLIRAAFKTAKTQGIFRITNLYLREAISAGKFAGVTFVEFRDIIVDRENPNSVSAFRTMLGIEWLCEHGESVGIAFPKLPRIADSSFATSFPPKSTLAPYFEAVAQLLESFDKQIRDEGSDQCLDANRALDNGSPERTKSRKANADLVRKRIADIISRLRGCVDNVLNVIRERFQALPLRAGTEGHRIAIEALSNAANVLQIVLLELPRTEMIDGTIGESVLTWDGLTVPNSKVEDYISAVSWLRDARADLKALTDESEGHSSVTTIPEELVRGLEKARQMLDFSGPAAPHRRSPSCPSDLEPTNAKELLDREIAKRIAPSLGPVPPSSEHERAMTELLKPFNSSPYERILWNHYNQLRHIENEDLPRWQAEANAASLSLQALIDKLALPHMKRFIALNGLVAPSKSPALATGLAGVPLEVFCSYSHKDDTLLQKFKSHLAPLIRENIISIWTDHEIAPGHQWEGHIDQHLESAQVIILLVSANFIASNYCWDVEVKRAMQRHESRGALVVPVILRACDWTGTPFAKLKALPKDGKAVTNWSNVDAAFKDVAVGIRHAIDDFQKKL